MSKDKMLQLIESFPELIKTGYEISGSKINFRKNEISNIVYAGMGGSALAGDVIKELIYNLSDKPMEVVRNYDLPSYVSCDTLVIISSFSGNTEETLSCFKQAIKKKSFIIAISSGGEVEKIAKKCKADYIHLPVEIPPRTAFGMTLFALLRKFESFLKNDEFSKMVDDALERMDEYIFDYDTAKKIAEMVDGRIPIFYTDSAFSSVTRRIVNQFSENSKHFAHYNLLPEMNHNEIVGLMKPSVFKQNSIVFFISFKQGHQANKRRIDITDEIIEDAGFRSVKIYFEDNNVLFSIIDSIIIFDLASNYLAKINRVDSMAIERIKILKEKIKG